MEERSVPCRVAGKDYPMALTLRATKAITERFGDLEALGDKLRTAPFGEQLDMVLWLLSLLMAEGCAQENFLHPEQPQLTPPTQELLELFFTPGDLVGLRDVIFRCMTVGLGREVQTEDDGKNPEAGQETASSLLG